METVNDNKIIEKMFYTELVSLIILVNTVPLCTITRISLQCKRFQEFNYSYSYFPKLNYVIKLNYVM